MLPLKLTAFTSAPRRSAALTTRLWPFCAPIIAIVLPWTSRLSAGTPLTNNLSMSWTRLCLANEKTSATSASE